MLLHKIIQFFIILIITQVPLHSTITSNEKIVLIHGFLGAPWNFHYHKRMLQKANFNAIPWGYVSRKKTIQMHAEDLVNYLKEEASQHPQQRIHFLTHSMGGLVLRAALNHPECPVEAKSGRAVLLAPPNQGSIWGRILGKWKIASIVCKDQSGRELLTESNLEYLGEFPDSMQIKVIAGDQGFNPFLSSPNDGTVTTEETCLNTLHEHTIIHTEHHFILLSKKANQLITEFFLRP